MLSNLCVSGFTSCRNNRESNKESFPTSNVPNSAVSNAAVNTVVVVLRVGNSISVVERKP